MTQLRASVARGLTDSTTALRAAQVESARLAAPVPAADPALAGPLADAAAGTTTGPQDPTFQALYDTPPAAAPATPPTPPATAPSEADRRASAIYARALPAVERERTIINNPSSTPAQRAAAHGRIEATLQRVGDACRARGGALPRAFTAALNANEQAMARLIGGTGMLRFNEANLTRRQADLAAVTPAPTGLANATHQLNVERARVTGSREAGALEATLQRRIGEAQQARYALEAFRLRTNAGSHMSDAAKDATASARAQVFITREFGGPTSRGLRQAREARDNYASSHRGATTSNDPVFQRLSERADRLAQSREQDIEHIDATIGRIAGGFTESSDDFSGGLFSELETLVTQGRLSREDADRNVGAVHGAMQQAYRTSLDPAATAADVLEAAVGVETASAPAQDHMERARLANADRSEAVIAADLRMMADRRTARAGLPALMRAQTETVHVRDAARTDLSLFDSLHPEVQRQTSRPTAAGPAQTLWDERRAIVGRVAVASAGATRAQSALNNLNDRIRDLDRGLQHMRLLIHTEGLSGTGPTDTELVAYAQRFNAAFAAEVAADVQRVEVAALRVQRDLTPSEPGDLAARPAIATRGTVDAALTAALERLRPLSTTERSARRELQLQENAMTRALEGWQPPPANARPLSPAIPAASAADPWRFYDEQLVDADLAVRYGGDVAGPAPDMPPPDGLFAAAPEENRRLATEALAGRGTLPANPTGTDAASVARTAWLNQARGTAAQESLADTARNLHAALDPVMETGRAIHGMAGTTALDRTAMWNSVNFSEPQTAWAALTAPAAPTTPAAPGAPA